MKTKAKSFACLLLAVVFLLNIASSGLGVSAQDMPTDEVVVQGKGNKDIIYQDYESVSTNPFLTSSSDAFTKSAMPGVPEIYTPSGYQDGNVAVMDYSKVTLSSLNENQLMYPRGIIYNGTPDKTDKLPYVPSMDDGYTLSVDICNVTGYGDEYFWICLYAGEGQTHSGFQIKTSQFDAGVWYSITFKATAGSVVATKAAYTAQGLSSPTGLTYTSRNTTSSRYNQILYTFYSNSGDMGEARQNACFMVDNFRLQTEVMLPVISRLNTTVDSESVIPLMVAYDGNGAVLDMMQGTLTPGSSNAEATFDVSEKYSTFMSATSVKIMYLDSESGAPIAAASEIADDLGSTGSANVAMTMSVELADSMYPVGADQYLIALYSVNNTATSANIPAYDPATSNLLYIGQSVSPVTELQVDQSLYDYNNEDIVILIVTDERSVSWLLEGIAPVTFTNVLLQLGGDESLLNFTWYSLSDGAGKVIYSKVSELVDGAFSGDACVSDADRTVSKKVGYFANKATITGLMPNTEYAYRLVNGDDESPIYRFTTSASDSFSFVFAGDQQIGRGYGSDNNKVLSCIEEDGKLWGYTLSQMMSAEEFEGIDFLMSAGDLINSGLGNYEYHEQMFDGFANHDELLSLPVVTVLGNHDDKNFSVYSMHTNQPNMLTKPDGTYYGATYETSGLGGAVKSADYYFIYNGALFIVLNTNTFSATSDSDEAREKDRLSALEHAEFVEKVMEAVDGQEFNWTIVLYHQSPYGSSYHGNYTQDSDGNYLRTEQYEYINVRELLIPVLYENGVDLILSGHDHCYTRTHIIKPDTDENGNYIDSSVITPYEDNNYLYADGTTTPTYVPFTDSNGNVYNDIKVASKPVQVTDPDGILHITAATSSGSQVNPALHENLYTAVNATADTRHLTRIDVSENELKIVTYNMGADFEDDITVVDTFTILRSDINNDGDGSTGDDNPGQGGEINGGGNDGESGSTTTDYSAEISELNALVASLKSALDALKNELSAKADGEAIFDEIDRLDTAINGLSQTISSLGAADDAILADIESISSDIEDIEAMISGFGNSEEDIISLRDAISKLEASLEKYCSENDSSSLGFVEILALGFSGAALLVSVFVAIVLLKKKRN